MLKKKGQELPLNTVVILIIVALVIVLVIVVYWDQISSIVKSLDGFIKGTGAVEDVKIQ